MTYVDILDDAMYSDKKLKIKTKIRGDIIGTPYCVDEYEADPERLGYCLYIGDHEVDTVFIDEIIEITDYNNEIIKSIQQDKLAYASGK